MSRNKRVLIATILPVALLVSALLSSINASAMGEEEIYRNLLIGALEDCYRGNEMKTTVNLGSFSSFGESVLKKGTHQSKFFIPTGIGKGNNLDIDGDANKNGGTRVGCHELFLGDEKGGDTFDGTMDGLYELFGKRVPEAGYNTMQYLAEDLGYIGYTKDVLGEANRCIVISAFKDMDDDKGDVPYGEIGRLCWDWETWHNNTEGNPSMDYELRDRVTVENKTSDFMVDYKQRTGQNYNSIYVVFGSNNLSCETSEIDPLKKTYDASPDERLLCSVNVKNNQDMFMYEMQIYGKFEKDESNNISAKEMPDKAEGYKDAINYFAGKTAPVSFTKSDEYDLYKLYLNKVFVIEEVAGSDCVAKKDLPNGPIVGTDSYTYVKKEEKGWCRVKPKQDNVNEEYSKRTVSVFEGGEHTKLTGYCGWECLLKKIYDLDPENLNVDPAEPGKDPTDLTDEDDAEKVCKDGSGVLGWLLCPVIIGIARAGEDLYAQVEKDFLQIRSDEFFKTDGGVEKAWGYFRDIANVAFIILFLVVIFSQLTGIGIDNYGIKKILPKIIVAAILVNLSLIICKLAADLSNILGAGLKNMFTSLADELSFTVGEKTYEVGAGQSLAAVGIGGGGLLLFGLFSTGFVGIGAAVVAVVIAVFGAAVSLVTTIFFLYLILLIRNAGIVILIAISPVAFVCYMLPNTEGLFKKWVSLFKALLVVYPICGLLVGGGILAGHILGSIPSEPMKLAGMIVEVLPFFLIPSVLRSSLSLMGNVGARLSGVGKSLGRKGSTAVKQGIRNTDKYKNFTEFNTNRAKARRAQRTVNRLNRRSGGDPANLSARKQDKLLNATKTVNEQTQRRAEARAGLAVVNADVAYQEKANERIRQEEKNKVGVTALNPDIVRRELENQKIQADVEQDVNVSLKPLLNRQNVETRMRNAVNEARADNAVPVLEVNEDLARQRRQSARDSQEYKNYQDQFAGMSREDIMKEAGYDAQTGQYSNISWLNEQGGAQRMSALLNALESRGMEKDMSAILAQNDVSKMNGSDTVLQTLASSKNAVFSAYGKRAKRQQLDSNNKPVLDANGQSVYDTVSFDEFMTGGTTKADGSANSQSMAAYFHEKGVESISKLDDKSLGTIAQYQQQLDKKPGNTTQIMSTDLLVESASRMNSEDSVGEINKMIEGRKDVKITGEQLANFNNSTAETLAGPKSSISSKDAIVAASEDAKKNPELMGKMKSGVRQETNKLRKQRNMGPI